MPGLAPSLYTRFTPDPDDPRAEFAYPLWAGNFLHILAETGNVGLACEAAGISIQMYRNYRFGERRHGAVSKKGNAQFNADVEDALDRSIERLRLVAFKRATAPGGSDRLLMMLLKAHDPQLYNPPRVVEHHEDPAITMRVEEMRQRLLDKLGGAPQLPPGEPVDAEFREAT